MSKEKQVFELKVPIEGKIVTYKTDLICNSCGKQLKDGEYLYFCMKEKDDLCSSFQCLRKHAGHRFFRWGRIEMEGSIDHLVKSRTAPPTSSSPLKPTHPPMGVPIAPPMAPPTAPSLPAGPPTKGPVITPSILALRTEMLSELSRLSKIISTAKEDLDEDHGS